MTILSIFILLFILVAYVIYANPRKDTLYIYQNGENIDFLLTDDLYISIKHNESMDKYSLMKDVIKARAFELKNLVENIIIFNSNEEEKSKELLKILKQSK